MGTATAMHDARDLFEVELLKACIDRLFLTFSRALDGDSLLEVVTRFVNLRGFDPHLPERHVLLLIAPSRSRHSLTHWGLTQSRKETAMSSRPLVSMPFIACRPFCTSKIKTPFGSFLGIKTSPAVTTGDLNLSHRRFPPPPLYAGLWRGWSYGVLIWNSVREKVQLVGWLAGDLRFGDFRDC